jgi:hypothetical protein
MTSSPSKQKRRSAQQRVAAQRSAAARERLAAERRRRLLLRVGAPIAGILLIVALLVVVKVVTGGGGPKSGQVATAASGSVISDVTGVPATVLNTVGAGTVKTPPSLLRAPALTVGGKPRVLYVGAEYCPYCATERWAMVIALSRFGTFTGLGQTTSSPSDVYPSTATLSFHGATYTSTYLSFTGKEIESNQAVNGAYARLDTLSAADEALVQKYSPGSIPFVDIGGQYMIAGAEYDPQLLHGKTHAQIAAALSDPSSAIAQGADGTANVITAALCSITANQPAAVCTSPGVHAGAAKLPRA